MVFFDVQFVHVDKFMQAASEAFPRKTYPWALRTIASQARHP